MTFEIELKIQLQDNEKQKLESYLSSNEFLGEFTGGFEQMDYYFDTRIPSFAKNDTALRVRVEKPLNSAEKKVSSIELTYKGKKLNPDSKTRLEYNLYLAPESDFTTIENFFNELGFICSFNIFKTRKNYLLEPGVVLSCDTNELGEFIEIEKIIEDKNSVNTTEEYLWSLLQKMLGNISKDRKIVKSYLELILESRLSK